MKQPEIVQPFARSMPYNSWYKLAKEVSNEYSWTYVNLPTKIKQQLIEFGESIDPKDLYKKEADEGIERDGHITIKYALLTNEFKDVKDLLKGEDGGKFYLGESSIFESNKYDVVKIDVESEDLKRLHDKLNNLPHEDKYPEYHAHATIAYLKKGEGKKYIGKFKIDKSFSFDELFFGDQDKKDHKIKLSFNLSWYCIAQIWNVDRGDDGIEDKIAALYELEYKYSMVRDRFNGMSERKANILQNLEMNLNEVLGEVKDILLKVFGEWLSKHALLSADTWAKARMADGSIEDVGVEDAYHGLVREYVRYKIYGGQNRSPTDKSAYKRFFSEMLEYAKNNIDNFPIFSRVLESGLEGYKEMMIDTLAYEGFKEFGKSNGKRFKNQDQAENWISNLTVKDVDPDSLFYSEGISGFASMVDNMGLAEDVLEEFYKNFVFPHWVEYWMDQGIAETRENIENIYKQLQQISPSNIRNSLAIISVALNLAHQTGDMLDYISDYAGGSGSAREMKGFLDEMSAGKRSEEWNKELREIGVNI